MIEAKDIEGKKIKEIMNNNTKVLDKLNDGWDDEKIIFARKAGTVGDITVLYTEYHVFIFDKKELQTVFYCYEMSTAALNKNRGVVIAAGHESIHIYWLDNGEYDKHYTR